MQQRTNLLSQVPDQDLQLQWEYMDRVRALVEEKARRRGRPMLALVHSFGCQGNVADGEKLAGMLLQMGYTLCDNTAPINNPQLEEADLILFNTCAVRENAEEKLYSAVGALRRRKRQDREMIIGLCGCMMQQSEVSGVITRSFPQVDLIFGTHVMHTFPQLLWQALTGKKRVIDTSDDITAFAEGLPTHRLDPDCASVQIMYGCDNFCSYCIVPYVRGREISRTPGAILQEVRQALDAGYKEILLLGQNVNSYGKGLPDEERISFGELLEQINALPGEFRIRFMTSHPKDFTPALIDTIARCQKVSRLLHLPAQSGCDRVLREMNRRYTREQYLSLVHYAKEKIPGVRFTSDIIVGFPGEQYEEFQQTLSLVREVGYLSLYTFIYSPRPGTRAAQMPDPVPYQEKTRWMKELLDLCHQLADEGNASFVGQTVRVLVQEEDPQNPGMLLGRSDHGLPVRFTGSREWLHRFCPVKITHALRSMLEGEALSQQPSAPSAPAEGALE